ncbi:MAG: rhamnogalacturonan lyase family protein, partial [Planctomycetota bacterium]
MADAKDKPYYASIKFQGDYRPQRIAVADLNGDGTYDFVIKQPSRGIDPAGKPNTEGLTYKLEAYLNNGTFLWRKDLGPGIEPGIWYSPFVVYDFDGDDKAEVAVKTGPEDARESDGRVRKGPEWCSILEGMTGAEITRADWPPRDPRLGDYNRTNRNQMGMAYLDGKIPCLLVARGTYKLMIV